MSVHNLIKAFSREIEILKVEDQGMYLMLDRKGETGNACDLAHYDFASGEAEIRFSLKDTRLYESFRTFDKERDYFYAETVADDYQLTLTRINSQTWEKEGFFKIKPEGEILNIYPIDRTCLIIAEEIKATDEVLEQFDDEDYEGRYYTLFYLYHLLTGERLYFQKSMDYHQIQDVKVIGDSIYMAASSSVYSENKKDQLLLMKAEEGSTEPIVIYETEDDEKIRQMLISGDSICLLTQKEGLVKRVTVSEKQDIQEESFETGDAEIIMEDGTGKVYAVTSAETVCVRDLLSGEDILSYDSEYGDFTGMATDDHAVTTFYKTEMLREDMVFRECIAVFDLHQKDKEPFVTDGEAHHFGKDIILTRSFLYL